MRRSLALSMLLLSLAAVTPSQAETTSAVFAVANQYLPGDKDVLAEADLPGIAPPIDVVLFKGDQMQFTNADTTPHSLTSLLLINNNIATPRFGSNTLLGTGGTTDVRGVTSLPVGRYEFRCTAHGFMRGFLNVIPPRPQ